MHRCPVKSYAKPYTCVGLLAREHGLAALNELVKCPDYKVLAVFTHKNNPKAYDVEQRERADFREFNRIAAEKGIPLYSIDRKLDNQLLTEFTKANNFDLLLSISWRYLVSKEVLEKANIGAVNIHRGDLPKYAGAEPIRRALENKEEQIAICAHQMTEEIDAGKLLCKATHPVNYLQSQTLEENVERLKKDITPHFPKLAFQAFEKLIQGQGNYRPR
jgi:methionyl-tRNA formyltransferase